jgi:hypothetical protein
VKLYAIVTTTRDEPDRPHLYEAFDAAAIGHDPMALDSPARTGLAESLHEPLILAAKVVTIEVDDEALLAELRRDTPTIGGVVAD